MITANFQEISARVRAIEEAVGKFGQKGIARGIRRVQELERDHLGLMVKINEGMVRMARDMFEVARKRVEEGLEEDGDNGSHGYEKRVEEIDKLKSEEAKILEEINE